MAYVRYYHHPTAVPRSHVSLQVDRSSTLRARNPYRNLLGIHGGDTVEKFRYTEAATGIFLAFRRQAELDSLAQLQLHAPIGSMLRLEVSTLCQHVPTCVRDISVYFTVLYKMDNHSDKLRSTTC